MFGRDLIEQVRADTKGEKRCIPVIVEKCIDAVDALGEFVSLDDVLVSNLTLYSP